MILKFEWLFQNRCRMLVIQFSQYLYTWALSLRCKLTCLPLICGYRKWNHNAWELSREWHHTYHTKNSVFRLHVKILSMVGSTWCRVVLTVIRIGLSHRCITELASWSCGLCLLVLCCHVMSRRSPRPSLMHGVVLVHCLLLLIDWLNVHVLCHGHGSPLSEDDSLMRLVIVCSHGTSYPMTDLYDTAYDWLLLSATTPLLIAAVLGSRYFGYWLANCFIQHLSYYLWYSGHSMVDSRCYLLGRCGLQWYV